MNRRSTLTHITPLPPHVTRDVVIALLHDHSTIITLNPLVTHHGRCTPPEHALPDEQESAWYEITDRIEYIPHTGLTGSVTYTACMHDIPNGIQTHVYAPAGLEIRGKWQLLGWLPGEERDAIEINTEHDKIPREGLYLREDCDLKCNILMLGFVKKNIHKSHKVLVQKLLETAAHRERSRVNAFPVLLEERPSDEISDNNDDMDGEKPKFNQQRQRAALAWQNNGYSVSVTGGRQRVSSLHIDRTQSFTTRGRSQSPSYPFMTTILGSSTRNPSEGPSVRVRSDSPTSAPSSGSSRGDSLVRTLSRTVKMKGRETPMSSRAATPEA